MPPLSRSRLADGEPFDESQREPLAPDDLEAFGAVAGLVSFRKDGRMVCYRLAGGFPHQMVEHCLRELLAIAIPKDDR